MTTPDPATPVAGTDAAERLPRWIFHSPDSGTHISADHPVQSGEYPDAEDIRPATKATLAAELRQAWQAWADDRDRFERDMEYAIGRTHGAEAANREAAAEIARLRAEVAMLRKPAGETIGWDSETMAELVSARDQIASDRRCERRDECAASSAIFRDCACMRSAVQRRTPR